jgi:hypothetical protein
VPVNSESQHGESSPVKLDAQFTIYNCDPVHCFGSRVVNPCWALSTSPSCISAGIKHHLHGRKRREPKLTFPTVVSGIDLAILIAVGSAVVDILSLMQPWLLGVNDEYIAGKGLTYAIQVEVSGFQLVQNETYLAILILPAVLAGISVILAMLPQDLTARISYKLKSGILMTASIALSLYPSYVFTNNIAMGTNMTAGLNVIVSFWEMGSGATLPAYAGFGFAAALLLRIFKD